MSDRLEKFIKENKKNFDEFEPPFDLWEKIEKKLDDQKNEKLIRSTKVLKLSNVLRIAAVLLLVISAGIVLWKNQQLEKTELSDIDPQLAKQQIHYASMIEEKRSELKRIEKEDPQLYKEFSSEIKAMDETYQKLKNDLPSSPNQEETVKAMIRNLQIQIEVLNQQLQIIKQVDQFKKESQNETQSI
jgi:hypothetical protein